MILFRRIFSSYFGVPIVGLQNCHWTSVWGKKMLVLHQLLMFFCAGGLDHVGSWRYLEIISCPISA